MKLGEVLVNKGLVTPAQLEVALQSQLILGGHLGTCLIEFGFIDEDALGTVLSEIMRVPYAPPHAFERIADTTIAAIPAKIAEEYLAVPIRVENNVVHIALVNPRDLHSLDELSFAVGRRVIPWVAPEVRIYEALEIYYGVPRRARFIALFKKMEGAQEQRRRFAAKSSRPDEAAATADTPSAGETSPGELGARDLPSDQSSDDTFGYGKSWLEIAEELDRQASATPAGTPAQAATPAAIPAAAARPPDTKSSPSQLSLSELADRYCRADSTDDLARAVLDFSSGRADRLLLLTVKGQRASIWHEHGFAITNETRRLVTFQVTNEAIFHVLMGDDHYYGALPPGDGIQSFFRDLGVEAPRELLLIPIRVNDLLVAVALADGGRQGTLHGGADEFLRAFRLFGMSISMLAMKRKIRDAARQEARVAVGQGDRD